MPQSPSSPAKRPASSAMPVAGLPSRGRTASTPPTQRTTTRRTPLCRSSLRAATTRTTTRVDGGSDKKRTEKEMNDAT
ncbi:hypothetical protein VHUM_00023 [Vanrija humicola]|uniref:Uncharacterized protein n=1 Tax=Vanrija humicola TaxID=5417 RepID=A0A7D8Z3X8_VANHU|nr:hypothetical protein VHUM_00023 [Vanrija humicola]